MIQLVLAHLGTVRQHFTLAAEASQHLVHAGRFNGFDQIIEYAAAQRLANGLHLLGGGHHHNIHMNMIPSDGPE